MGVAPIISLRHLDENKNYETDCRYILYNDFDVLPFFNTIRMAVLEVIKDRKNGRTNCILYARGTEITPF